MTDNPNELTIDNCAVMLIDHQPWVAFGVRSIETSILMKNVGGLARAARDLGLPTVLTTIGASGGILVDPIFKDISDVFPDVTPIDRTSTHAWSHPDVRAAIDATGRKKIVMAGLITEVCVAQSALAALKDAFEVYVVSDCSGGSSKESHEDAKARMMQAGAKLIDWVALVCEWVPDYTAPEAIARNKIFERSGGMIRLQSDYPMAQVEAGLLSLPEALSDYAPTRAAAGER